MDDAKILELAKRAGMIVGDDCVRTYGMDELSLGQLIAFARLVAAAERGRCAAVIESLPVHDERCQELMLTEQAWEEAQQQCADAIRSRTE